MRRENAKAGLTRRQLRHYRTILSYQGTYMVEVCYGYPKSRSDLYLTVSAYAFAQKFGGRKGVDLSRLQNIVIRSNHPYWAYRYARDIPGANVWRLSLVVMKYGSADLMHHFAENIPGANRQRLEAAAIIQEVFEM